MHAANELGEHANYQIASKMHVGDRDDKHVESIRSVICMSGIGLERLNKNKRSMQEDDNSLYACLFGKK